MPSPPAADLPSPAAAAPPSPADRPSVRAFHVLTKPIGPICNLDCKYCFYLEKEKLYPDQRRWRMPDDVLEAYVRQYIAAQPDAPEVSFAWQGGEPTLLGVDFFRRVVELQAKHAGGKTIRNALQTNGTLLDDEWCAFLSANGFLVGLSIDGPRAVHDRYRIDKHGAGTFDAVVRGLGLLRKHETPFNTLTVVSKANQDKPLEVYRFLKEIGSTVHQYIPLVERAPGLGARRAGLDLAEPPVLDGLRRADGTVSLPLWSSAEAGDGVRRAGGGVAENLPVTPWSVDPAAYGEFLVAIFDEWVRHDVGTTFVQLFDVMLGVWAGLPSTLCVFAERCGRALAVEHNGDVYSCDHFVYPRYKLGNVLEGGDALGGMVGGDRQRRFGDDKADTLPDYCRRCEVRFACNGECPKHRFAVTPDGEPGLNYLCPAYKRFLGHADPYLRAMAGLLAKKQSPARVMAMVREQEAAAAADVPPRAGWSPTQLGAVFAAGSRSGDPCPCGSGRAYAACCGA